MINRNRTRGGAARSPGKQQSVRSRAARADPDKIRVRKEWTFERARAAQKRFTAGGGKRDDPKSPFAQWAALQELEQLRARRESGEQYALTYAVRVCAGHSLPMPEWVARAYIEAFDTIDSRRAGSWEAVFGPAIPKGRHLAALRKEHLHSIAVWNAVLARHERGEPIDDSLFAEIGEKLGLGLTLTKRYYSLQKKFWQSY